MQTPDAPAIPAIQGAAMEHGRRMRLTRIARKCRRRPHVAKTRRRADAGRAAASPLLESVKRRISQIDFFCTHKGQVFIEGTWKPKNSVSRAHALPSSKRVYKSFGKQTNSATFVLSDSAEVERMIRREQDASRRISYWERRTKSCWK